MKKVTLLITAFLSFLISNGQIETRYFPNGNSHEQFGINKSEFKANNVKSFSPFNIERMVEEDNKRKDVAAPFRFGKAFDTNISLDDGEWIDFGGGKLWSMEFYSKKAYSLNFVFNDFYLSENAELYIANDDGTMLYGPVTNKNNPKNGFFLTDLIGGDKATVYLFEPNDSKKESKLTITRVVHAYKKVLPTTSATGFDTSLECNNDINCYPSWDTHSDAVGLILLSNGNEWCSGSLLMSTDQSFRPYFLTAFHCIDTSNNGVISSSEESNAENWLFKFQYKMTSCNGNSANYGYTYNGAELRAAWQNTDFALMEMDQSPVGNNQISWAGWDKRSNTPTSGTNIHHPNGDVMKISFDNDNLTSNSSVLSWAGGTSSAINTHWVADIDNGAVQGGSSGSPIFNQNNRVVGQLHGGFPGCEPVMRYGKFNLAWTGGGTNSTRLSNWLDPCNTGSSTTNTTRSPSLSGNDFLCSSNTYTVFDLPSGSTINWTSSSNITRNSSQGANPCTFSAIGNGNGWIKATITNPSMCGGTTVIEKIVSVGKPDINDYTLVWSGPSCINYNWTNISFGVQKNSSNGCSLQNLPENITEVDWQIIPSQPINTTMNAGIYSCVTNSVIDAGVRVAFSSQNNPYVTTFRFRVKGNCGWSDWSIGHYYLAQSCNYYSYSVYPNPTSETLNLEKKQNKENTKEEETIDSYELYDLYSNLISKGSISNKMNIDVSNYKKGIYVLKIILKDKPEIHQVIIE
ncbi:T9SS type A sorting domain-containing protein [Aureibaculum conchae]|uniref:T9SS type A sorting domain-containing protein n=1 Tax=Aureibaculum sp. 2308TA14-22 TaxID=3108392 RepID=UPI003394147C